MYLKLPFSLAYLLRRVCCLLLLLMGMSHTVQADSLTVQLNPLWQGAPLVQGQSYTDTAGHTFSITTFRCYLSLVTPPPVRRSSKPLAAQLFGFEDGWVKKYALPARAAKDSVRLGVGLDSFTTVTADLAHQFDPIHGMYWAWQTGFIFIKIEGEWTAKGQRPQPFQYHIGGYAAPFNAFRSKVFAVQDQQVQLQIDLGEIIPKALPLGLHIMSPNAGSIRLAQQFIDALHAP